jgi:transposase
LPQALEEKPRSGQPKKYNERDEAEIIALTCTKAPDGRNRWTVRLLTEELRKKYGLKSINRESVRLILKKTGQNLG